MYNQVKIPTRKTLPSQCNKPTHPELLLALDAIHIHSVVCPCSKHIHSPKTMFTPCPFSKCAEVQIWVVVNVEKVNEDFFQFLMAKGTHSATTTTPSGFLSMLFALNVVCAMQQAHTHHQAGPQPLPLQRRAPPQESATAQTHPLALCLLKALTAQQEAQLAAPDSLAGIWQHNVYISHACRLGTLLSYLQHDSACQ